MCSICGRLACEFDNGQSFRAEGSAVGAFDSQEPQFAPTLTLNALIGNETNGRWNANVGVGNAAFVTFNFPTAIPDYDSATDRPGFAAFSEAQKASARAALDAWAAVSGIVFLEVQSTTAADIRFGLHNFSSTAFSGSAGYAYFPYLDPASGFRSEIGGDIYVNSVNYTSDTLSSGFGFHILLHEIGHAIGLKHPFDGSPTLPSDQNNTNFTVLAYNGPSQTKPQSLDIAAVQYLYGAQDPNYFWDYFNETLTIFGQDSAETKLGSQLNDIVVALGGNDIVNGLGGNDWLFGGDGSDVVNGGDGNDVLYGDTFSYEAGSDYLYGDAGNDILIGGALTDVLYGGTGNDWLFGSNGDDIGRGGDGNDVFYGDLFAGEFGNDYAEGELGNDILIGGEGNDILYGGFATGGDFTGDDWLFGSNGNDILYGGFGNDTLYGDLFAGEVGTDLIVAGDGNDFLWGGDGNDTLIGGNGTDNIFGGSGRDSFVFANTFEAVRDIINDFVAGAGGDVVDLRGAGYASTSFATFLNNYVRQAGSNTVLDFDGAGTTYEVTLFNVTRTNLTADNFFLV